MKQPSLIDIFWTFFKIGLFTFGGGYAMIHVMHEAVVDHKKWIDEDEMIELITISQSTPGPFAINGATYIGFHQRKFLGALFATLGVIIPSFIVIITISFFLQAFASNQIVQNVLLGINAGVSVLIFHAWFRLSKRMTVNVLNISLMIIALLVSFFTDFSVIYMLLIAAGFALFYTYVLRKEHS